METVTSAATDFWTWRIKQAAATLVVTGTSDSADGRVIEAAARIAARLTGVSVAAVEDYPGNYLAVEEGEVDLLLLESHAAINLARSRLGGRCPRLQAISPARFDTMRLGSASAKVATRERWLGNQAKHDPAALLWVGQPETEDGVAALEALLPAVHAGGWRLMFRAHPRDAGYVRGAYRAIADVLGPRFADVTALHPGEVFALAPRLVVTQFSSMVVEAGFHGIPSLCLLFRGGGLDRLYQKKGYHVPLACEAGAIGLCTEPVQLPSTLHRLLENEQVRGDMLSRFDEYYASGTTTAAASAKALEILMCQGI